MSGTRRAVNVDAEGYHALGVLLASGEECDGVDHHQGSLGARLLLAFELPFRRTGEADCTRDEVFIVDIKAKFNVDIVAHSHPFPQHIP